MTLFDRQTRRTALATLMSAPFGLSRAAEKTSDGYRIPRPDPELRFPADHGSHPDFRIEWWYLTGHLFSGKRRFGTQATFFRLAQRPGIDDAGRAFADSQLYLAHFALTDIATGRFLHEERLNRQGWDADSAVGDLDARNGDWSLKRLSGLKSLDDGGAMRLRGGIRSEASLNIGLVPAKPAVVFGEKGVSRKGDEPAAASLYITFPRLRASGALRIGGEELAVEGEIWMDHEVSSSQLGRDPVGWDWVSAQFFDGRELMAYVLRQPDGSPDRFSTLAWIGTDGRVAQRRVDEFTWRPGGQWKSPQTGAAYPIRPSVSAIDPATGKSRTFTLRPVMDGQEMTGGLGGISYWEGACDVLDESGGAAGRAYLELTGYAGDDLGRRLRGG